jgi:putative protease
VAYSGQCFSSEAWGGRSANRGQCAQACRLPYDLIVDGEVKPLGDARYLLSPGDLYTLRHIPEIVQLGVSALKIEGRYKDAEYVALTTVAYRKAVDEAWSGLAPSLTRLDELQLEQVYSRGLGPFFLSGTNHQLVVQGRAPRHRGVWMGRVTRVVPDRIWIEASTAHRLAPLKPGDGVVFDAASWRSPEEEEQGGRIFEVLSKGRSLELRFGNGAIDFDQIRPGDLVWRTHDPEIDRLTRPYLEASTPVRKQPLTVRIRAAEGKPLETEWSAGGHIVMACSAEPCGIAQSRTLDEAFARDQLGRLGNTSYALAQVELQLEGRPFVPASVLNQVRREAVERLEQLQCNAPQRTIGDPLVALESFRRPIAEPPPGIPQLHLLVRTPGQLDAAIAFRPASITLDYLDLYGLRPSVEAVKAAGLVVRVASPRVLKPGEEKIGEFLLKLECPILVRSSGLLVALRSQAELIGDFSLNAANSVTASMLLEMGLARITPTHDLNAGQVADLARRAGRVEAIVYQHLPVFHTEHCVFCRFLSTGTSYRDCGRPCEKHRVAVRDVSGRSHPVLADVGCRNTVFAAEAQEASQHLESWLEAGIRDFRLEFAHESGEETLRVARAFEMAMQGRTTCSQLRQELKAVAPQGITEGSLFVPRDYLTLPILQ